MRLVRFEPNLASEWDEFISHSKNGTLFHSRAFLSYHPPERFQDYSYMAYEGDRLVAFDARHVLHVESKRQERVRIPEWMRQATAEAKNGRVPVVVFRQSRGEWTATLRLVDLLELAHG